MASDLTPTQALAKLVAVVKSKWPDIDWDLDTSAWGAPMRYAIMALADAESPALATGRKLYKHIERSLAAVSAGTLAPWRLVHGNRFHYIKQGDHTIAQWETEDGGTADAETIMVLARAAGLA